MHKHWFLGRNFSNSALSDWAILYAGEVMLEGYQTHRRVHFVAEEIDQNTLLILKYEKKIQQMTPSTLCYIQSILCTQDLASMLKKKSPKVAFDTDFSPSSLMFRSFLRGR